MLSPSSTSIFGPFASKAIQIAMAGGGAELTVIIQIAIQLSDQSDEYIHQPSPTKRNTPRMYE